MKRIVCVAVGIVMDLPDDESTVSVPLPTNPMDELAARLRSETPSGREKSRPDFTMPGVTAWMGTAFRDSPDRN